MCTLIHDPAIKLSKKEKIVAYKVFGFGFKRKKPLDFAGENSFKFGLNTWDDRPHLQKGFQVFVSEEDAYSWLLKFEDFDLIVPVTILTKNIVKASNDFDDKGFKAYEVKKFSLWKKDWERTLKERTLKEKNENT